MLSAVKIARATWTFALLGMFAPHAEAWVVEQKVGWTQGGAKVEAIYSWFATEREFRLDVKRGSEVKNFVFNGRVFYVCGRLSQPQLAFLKSLKIEDQGLVDSLSKGACQEAGTNFATRFFLAPFDTAANAEAGGGYGATLTLEEPEIEITGSVEHAAGTKCVNFTRNVTITDKSGEALTLTEKACNATAIKWRQGFSRELGMTMIRQAGGKQNYQAISDDMKKMSGLSLTAAGDVKGKDSAGKTVARSFDVKSTMAKDRAPTPAEAALPAGYEIIDPKNLAAVAAKATLKAPSGGDQGSVVANVLTSLILGANPAGGAFSAVMTTGAGAAPQDKTPPKKK